MQDKLIQELANYVAGQQQFSDEAYETARFCLADSLGCALLALHFPACTKLLGPLAPGATGNTPVPGTPYKLDPVLAAFNMGLMIRWLDFNDTFLAAEWGHPSDNLGGLLAVASDMPVGDLLTAMIKAYEIQGALSLRNSLNKIGFDHVLFVKVATAAVVTAMLGGSCEQIAAAISQAFIDVGPLRTYRHAPNVGSRKSWAAGDATSRGVWLALLTLKGELGYSTPLTAPKWGFYDVLFKGEPFQLERPLGCYVMENILFKVAFPAEFHAQTAVECALQLHPKLIRRFEEIERINLITQRAAMQIIDKSGPLKNPADRDHCLQYMVAVALLKGHLTADDYEEAAAADPRIDWLRSIMAVEENLSYSQDYLDPEKRSIANAIQVHFKDGSNLFAEVQYPLGSRRRRKEAIPLIFQKLEKNLQGLPNASHLVTLFQDHQRVIRLSVKDLLGIFDKSIC